MSNESENAADKPSEQSVVHTPGPWKSLVDECGLLYVETDQSQGNEVSAIVCVVSTFPVCELSEPERHLADANLLAAAPDLLAALRQIRGELCRRHSPFVVETAYAYINDAINKATGKVV